MMKNQVKSRMKSPPFVQFASFLPELHLHSQPSQSESQSESATGSSINSNTGLIAMFNLVRHQQLERAAGSKNWSNIDPIAIFQFGP